MTTQPIDIGTDKFFKIFPEYQGQLDTIKNIMNRVKVKKGDDAMDKQELGKEIYSMLKKIFRGHLVRFGQKLHYFNFFYLKASVQLKSGSSILNETVENLAAFMYFLADESAITILYANCKEIVDLVGLHPFSLP